MVEPSFSLPAMTPISDFGTSPNSSCCAPLPPLLDDLRAALEKNARALADLPGERCLPRAALPADQCCLYPAAREREPEVTPLGCRLTDHCAEAARIPHCKAFRA